MTYATVRAATSPELAYIRTAGQWSRLYLAFLTLPTVYSATLASLPSSTDSVVEIAFTGGSGTLANVFPDMTLYVGTTAGAYDLGMARIRKAPIAGTFYIGEESEINWQAGCHLTVIADFDLWAKHIRTVSDTEFYIDWDIAYTNQNGVFDPIPIMGGHRVLKLTGASVNAIFDFSNSYVIDSTISGYSLSVPTASGITGATTSTPTVTFNTAGWHPIYLTVTAANGKTHLGVRYVYVYNAANMPVTDFQLGNCSVDYETGGWSFEVTMNSQISLANVPDRALCILFAEDFYGDTEISIGQLAGCENIICVGRIADESININAEQSEVRLRIQGSHYWLGKVHAFPTGILLSTGTPANWVQMQSPTVDKVLYRLLRWGTTATTIMDVYLTNDTKIASELVSSSSSVWGQILEIAMATIQARPGVDRFGRLFVEVEPQLVPAASRTYATVMTITKVDWQGSANVERVTVGSTGMVNVSGVVVNSDGSGGALFGLAPGHVFKRYGTPEVIDRMLLLTQSLTNQQAGLFLGWKNNPFPNSEFRLSSNNRMLDCFPRQKVAWSIASSDSPRAFTLSGNFIPRRVDLDFDEDSGFLEVSVSLELESVENISINGDIPGNGGADLSDPPQPPDFPDFPGFGSVVILPTEVNVGEIDVILMLDRNEGIVRTSSFAALQPQWQLWNTGIDSADLNRLASLFVTLNGAVYVVAIEPAFNRWIDTIYRAASVGGTFVKVIDQTWLNSNVGGGGIYGVGYNKLQPEQVAFIGGPDSSARFVLGANTSWSLKASFNPGTNFIGGLSYGNGKWIWDKNNAGSEQLYRFNVDGSTLEYGAPGFGQGHLNGHYRVGTSGVFYKTYDLTDQLVRSPDNATTLEFISVPLSLGGTPVVAPDDSIMMGGWDTAGGKRGRSLDHGYSWEAMPNLPFGGYYAYGYMKGSGVNSHWIAAAGTGMLHVTENGGSDWTTKIGNMLTVIPTMNIVQVVIPGVI